MSKAELSTRRAERENQVVQHIFRLAFPDAAMAVPEEKNFFAVNVGGYIYKIQVTEHGQQGVKGGE